MQRVGSEPVAGRKRADSFAEQDVKFSVIQEKSTDFALSIQAVSNNLGDVFALLDATPFMDASPQQKPFDALDLLDKVLGVSSGLISNTCCPSNKSPNHSATAFGQFMMGCKALNSDDPAMNNEVIMRIAQTLGRYSDPTILFLVKPRLIDLKQIKDRCVHLKKLHEASAHFADDRLGMLAKQALLTHPDIAEFEKIVSRPESYYTFQNLAAYTVKALGVSLDTLHNTMRECVHLLSLFCDLIETIALTVMPKLENVAGIQFNGREIVANIVRFNAWWKDSPYLPLKFSVRQKNVLLDPIAVLKNDDLLKIPALILKQLNANADHLSRIMEMHPTGIMGEITPINQCSFKMLTLHALIINPVQRLVDLMGFQSGKLESTRQNGFAFLYQYFKQMYFISYRVSPSANAVFDRTTSSPLPKLEASLRKSEESSHCETEKSEGDTARRSPPMSRLIRRPSDPAIALSSLPSLYLSHEPVRGAVKTETSPLPLAKRESSLKESASPRLRERRKDTLNRPTGVRVTNVSETASIEANSPTLSGGVGPISPRVLEGEKASVPVDITYGLHLDSKKM